MAKYELINKSVEKHEGLCRFVFHRISTQAVQDCIRSCWLYVAMGIVDLHGIYMSFMDGRDICAGPMSRAC